MEIAFERVDYAYRRTEALRDVTWTVRQGVTGLLGPNGAGKTALLSVLIGTLKPKSGSVTIDGDANSGRQRFGYVPQRFSLVGEMRAIDTVAYAAWVNGVPRKQCESVAALALGRVKLADKAKDRVRSLSGGQRQRLGLAAGMAHEPTVLVLDEPTVGLDPEQRLRMREVVAEIGETNTVILSTHLMEDIAHLCERVGVLSHGRLVFDGTVDELSASMRNARGDSSASEFGSDFERGYDALIAQLGGDE